MSLVFKNQESRPTTIVNDGHSWFLKNNCGIELHVHLVLFYDIEVLTKPWYINSRWISWERREAKWYPISTDNVTSTISDFVQCFGQGSHLLVSNSGGKKSQINCYINTSLNVEPNKNWLFDTKWSLKYTGLTKGRPTTKIIQTKAQDVAWKNSHLPGQRNGFPTSNFGDLVKFTATIYFVMNLVKHWKLCLPLTSSYYCL